MPIEIRELYIKAVIDTGGGAGAAPSAGEGAASLPAATPGGDNNEQLLELCVEKVLEILKEKQER